MKRSIEQWHNIFLQLGVKPIQAALWSPVFAEVIDEHTFSAGDSELDDFLGQVLHESAHLAKLEENLNYRTPGRLMAVWPSRFKKLEDEIPYLNNPQALANKVYSGRMGNVGPDDGWRYRGSGLLAITGADNFRAVQEATGVPVFDNPELLRSVTQEALLVCLAWWEGNVPDRVLDNRTLVRKKVNGGTIGLAEATELSDKAKEVINES